MQQIDQYLNGLTMYRVVLYGLVVITVCAVIFSLFGILPYTATSLVLSLAILIPVSYGLNIAIGKLFSVNTNLESSIITALILFLILPPAASWDEARTLLIATCVAIVSKYVIVFRKKHIFNPAAIAGVILVAAGDYGASWWVGSRMLIPVTAVVGALIVRKIRRPHLFFSYFIAFLIALVFTGLTNGENIYHLVTESMMSWPVIFFGTVMLTEPLTTPPTRTLQIMYGALVGILSGLRFHFGPFYSTPEFALVSGNIISYAISPHYRFTLIFKKKVALSHSIYEFRFSRPPAFDYQPGQYLEWTVPPARSDRRGNRRYFTIASSPTEQHIAVTMKIPEYASSFKRTLSQFAAGDRITASQRAGDFTLLPGTDNNLVFIAGGIGITPFRSMIKFLIDTKRKRNITLIYTAPHPDEFVYMSLFESAQKYGVVTHKVLTKAENKPPRWDGLTGRLNETTIRTLVPDIQSSTFYISGPNAMVDSYKHLLISLAVPSSRIVTDYFPGL